MSPKAQTNSLESRVRGALDSSGYVHLPGVLPVAAVAEVRADARAVFLTQMRELGIEVHDANDEAEFSVAMFEFFRRDEERFFAAGKLCQHLVSLHRLSLSNEVMQILSATGMEFPTISTRPVMFFNSRHLAKSQGYWKTPPHQDWRSIQGSLNSIVIWVPLIDLDIALGTLEVVPGSHRHGLLDSTEDDFYRAIDGGRYPDEDFVPVNVKTGDCLIFSTFLVHRSGHNSTERVRWSCHFRYNDMTERTFVERQFPNPYVYKPQQDLITPGFPAPSHLEHIFRGEKGKS